MKFLHILLISLLLVGCAPQVAVTTPTPVSSLASTPASTAFLTPTSVPTSTSTPEPDPVLVGSGDIARCRTDSDEVTANLLDNIPGTIFTTGDNVYPDGAPEEFANCYDPSWGRHKERTYPSPGNHDYHTDNAAGYFEYFGSRAGEPGKGYYSYDLGTWHVIVLNSNLPVKAGSLQDQWLRADLAAHPDRKSVV